MSVIVEGYTILHIELWKLSDIDELFALVPLPHDVLIDVPELDDALAATCTLLGKVQKFAMTVYMRYLSTVYC